MAVARKKGRQGMSFLGTNGPGVSTKAPKKPRGEKKAIGDGGITKYKAKKKKITAWGPRARGNLEGERKGARLQKAMQVGRTNLGNRS